MHLNLLFDYVYGFEQILSFCLYLTLTGHCVPQGQRDYAMVLLHLTEPFFFSSSSSLDCTINVHLRICPMHELLRVEKKRKKRTETFFSSFFSLAH